MLNIRQKLDQILSKALILIMGIMVINVLWQVFSRFILNSPSSFTDELARYLMIWLGILGAAYVSGKNMHVAIDVLQMRLNESKQRKLRIFIRVLIILFCLFALVIGGFRLVYISHILGQHSPTLNIPLSLVYAIIPISGLCIIFYKVSDIFNLK